MLAMKFISCATVALVGALATAGIHLLEAPDGTLGKCWPIQDILSLLRNSPYLNNQTDGDSKVKKAPLYANRSMFPTEMRYASWVNPLMEQINKDRMKAFVTQFSSFYNRMCMSEDGVAASKWLKAQIQNATSAKGIQIRSVVHAFPQKSIIARFPGSDLANEVVVVGSHIDTINAEDFPCGPAPGADNNASGAAAILEAFRILAASGFAPRRTIEFHWYACEEFLQLGSREIAHRYYEVKKKVVAMAQFDMTGYLTAKRRIALIKDNVSPVLTAFLGKAVDRYLNVTHTEYTCTYECSDHAAWTEYGYPSAFPFEDKINPNIHKANVTIDFVNFDNVKEFTKLAIAYLVEIAEPANEPH